MDSRLILFNFLGQTIELVVLLLIFYFTRQWFDIETIGNFNTLLSISCFFNFVVDFGVGIAHINFYNKAETIDEKRRCNGALFTIKIIQIIILSIILLTQAFLNPFLYGMVDLSLLMCIGVITFHIFEQIIAIVFYSQKKVVKIRFGRTIGSLIRFISISLLYLYLSYSPMQSLTWAFLFQGILLLFYSVYLIKGIPLSKPSTDLLKKYVRYFFPFIFSTSIVILMQYIPILFLYSFGYSESDIGNYSTAFQLYSFILLFPPLVSQILLPTFSKNHNKLGENQNTRDLILRTHKYLSIVILLITILSIIFSEHAFVFL
ncbi:MAG: hypothetical protein ACTSWY_06155, partial [Promethearchaeota archaeon]